MRIAAIKQNVLLLLCIFSSLSVFSQNHSVINVDLGKSKISKHIYGHFAEHLGTCIYGGFYVGDTNKIIPNTNGVRNDIVDALKKTKYNEEFIHHRMYIKCTAVISTTSTGFCWYNKTNTANTRA